MGDVDLTGRCGTCGYFRRLEVDEAGRAQGDCRLGCWPSPLADTSTCPSHKPIGLPFAKPDPTRGRAPRPRRNHPEPTTAAPRSLPEEIALDMDLDDFRAVLRDVLREELGLSEPAMAERFRGGRLVLAPGKTDTQEKVIPIEVFFRKVTGVRDKLRVLEQKVNASDHLPAEEKLALQGYITQCYGSLTTFNVLFRDKDDHFVGTGRDE